MRIFALNDTAEFGEKVALSLGQPLDLHEERNFEDGEHKARPLASVRPCSNSPRTTNPATRSPATIGSGPFRAQAAEDGTSFDRGL